MKMGRIAALSAMLGSAMLASAPAQAAYVINIEEVGPDVVATGHGTVNTAALTQITPFASNAIWNAALAVASVGASSPYSYLWEGSTGPTSFGMGGTIDFIDNGGEMFGVITGRIILPYDYVSGRDLGESTARAANRTLASIGFTPGTYLWTWGSGADADSFTVNIGLTQNAVPEPATWAMMIGGLCLVGASLRRRKTIVSFG